MTNSLRPVKLEVAIASVDDAKAAQEGGADRLELNAALALGGLTVSMGMLTEVRAAVSLPVMVMIRPRPAGFDYGAADFKVMQRDIDMVLEHGVDGVVFGILRSDGQIDLDRCRTLARQAGGRETVFHRAFDVTRDPFEALEQLVDLGVRRVMTSGQRETAHAGAELIARLIHRAAGRIELLPAGGINPSNVLDIVARTGCDQIHASLKMPREDNSVAVRPQIKFGSAIHLPEHVFEGTNAEAVIRMREKLGQ